MVSTVGEHVENHVTVLYSTVRSWHDMTDARAPHENHDLMGPSHRCRALALTTKSNRRIEDHRQVFVRLYSTVVQLTLLTPHGSMSVPSKILQAHLAAR